MIEWASLFEIRFESPLDELTMHSSSSSLKSDPYESLRLHEVQPSGLSEYSAHFNALIDKYYDKSLTEEAINGQNEG